ncbi:outer membrane receptor for ferrienterochelin and colicins [Dyadobacter koreensis]|uniref:Outer membrane receptor for ferrienterochelin and colicins n=1 Tax=Dyadobacter koreensis TaxID=408657 RepID=A0A1H6Z928_9BACT|nr:TonB-dependent receptor [Dyadobacter koreensis]SEJ46172.1 outer membrane receptor for ferrienterochelin and colicins [Dyadobacter koreensis]
MKHFFAVTWIFVLSCTQAIFAQNGEIIGKILTQDSKSFEGVNITLKDTKYGSTTGSDGKFRLKAPAGKYNLIIGMLGIEKLEIPVEVTSGTPTILNDIQLRESGISLDDAVITGQFGKQSLRNSVYQVRTIDSERIKARGATNIQTILNTELGIRFSNDPTLGTTDIQLMGMSGQSVKILLDGIPMVDRGATRESLGQIDINTIERIEIVEGPMSVIYGTDALAGVINLITKKGDGSDNLTISARAQEETVSDEYNAFTDKGTHNQNLGIAWQKKGFQLSGSVTRNNFGGWQGDSAGRLKAWMPKEQMLYTAGIGYSKEKWNIWYRFNGTDETIKYFGRVSAENKAADKDYITKRWFHQAQGEFKASEKLGFTGALSYTDYSRRTLSTVLDLNTNRRTLSLDAAAQDKSIFTTVFFRGTALYKVNDNVTLLPGIEVNNNNSSGQRILGSPTINEYAFFISSELKITSAIKLSPAVRFIKNSVYNAPPVIPALNAKIILNKVFDLRMGYARGFRSPALRELYFDFHDASHSINGNVNLKAEYSNSFNSFLTWRAVEKSVLRLTSTLGGFYNVFHDRIDTGFDPNNPTQTTYLNISLYKTTGLTFDNKLYWKNIQASLGATYIGTYNEISEEGELNEKLPEFVWSPEINANLLYSFPKIGTSVNLFYKYTGKKPAYALMSTNPVTASLREISGYSMADITVTKTIGKYVSLIGGAKNLFDLTSIKNTTIGSAHDASGPGFSGRSYFLGLNIQWSKR